MCLEPMALPADPCEPPPGEKQCNADREQAWAGAHWTGGEQIDEQHPHADKLAAASEIVEALAHAQIRSKFFSISRLVSRSITGRPCGQTVEYAVARSSSRM
jgi:hypothetical protein